MARWLAFDWDQQEARYVVASGRGSRLVIEAAGRVDLAAEPGDGSSRLSVGSALHDALAPQRLGRARVLLGIGRNQVEVLNLTLPPSSDAELPEMVRNQAIRESNVVADDAVLDFVPLSDDPGAPRKVAAVALSRERLELIQATCADAGVTPDAMILRPYATAALLASASAPRGAASLLINVFSEEVDLSVLVDGRLVFWRTLRQTNASWEPAAAQKIVAEINRTLVVAQSQLANQSIEAAYLFGSLAEHPALLEPLQGELAVAVTLVDPFAGLAGSPSELPQNAGRFSSLLGMLTVESEHGSHAIDFLHPRKRPSPPDRRRTLILASVAAGLMILLGGYRVWSTFAEVDAENETLTAELDRLDDKFKLAGKQQKIIQAIRDWGESDVNWLDELRDLSLRLPGGRDAVLLRMNMSHSRTSGGTIEMTGVVRDPLIVSRIENSLRDKFHQIANKHVQERMQDKSYSWHFESSLVVAPREKRNYISHLPNPPDPKQEESPDEMKKTTAKSKAPRRPTAN
jgi:Tfp pilus assembly PilM family ATPase